MRQGAGDRSRTLDALRGVRELARSGQARGDERLGLSRTPVRAALARLERRILGAVLDSDALIERAPALASIRARS